ncbi:hypothetical protein IC232_16595 [Microvirga sp. BT688]|uniref:hypothetical protein n=1 Tax=Microvirga sp. TaxID=1873136 RepID=UPI001688289B|nr:hypothetical protein [Microvirga sp.]MBD2748318.1 hypothetical protein [Microvirga sp.]
MMQWLRVVLIFTLLGPLIAVLTLSTAGFMLNLYKDLSRGNVLSFASLEWGQVFGVYLFSLPSSFLLGLAVSMLPRMRASLEALSVLVLGLMISFFLPLLGLLHPVLFAVPLGHRSTMTLAVLNAVILTSACWYLSKYLNRPAGALALPPAQPRKARG